jgi:hypothetical protein
MAGYGTDEGFQAFLDAGGYSIPVSPPGLTLAVARQRGSDYIDAVYGARFIGYPTGGVAQERAWPRTNAVLPSGTIDPAVIPLAVVTASYYAALQEASKPGSLSVVVGGEGAVKRKKVGSLEIEYAGAGDGGSVTTLSPLLSSVDGLLAPFLGPAVDDVSTRIFFRALG